MLVKNCIQKKLPIFKASSSCVDAFADAEENGFSHVFVGEENHLEYAVDTRSDESDLGTTLQHHQQKSLFYIFENELIFQSLPIFAKFSSNIIPVLSQKMEIIGYITLEQVNHEIALFPFLQENGLYMILERDNRHFSLSEISRIVEENKGKVLGFFLSEQNNYYTQAVIKISTTYIDAIQSSLERYDYHIVQTFFQSGNDIKIKESYDYLQKYLEI